jgi:uncharacterized protein DUF6788
MSQRSARPAPERNARSRLAQLLTQQPFLRGSLVEQARSCGKPTCRGQRGQLHRSLYLAVRHNDRRALLYIPRALEETARLWVENGRRISQQLAALHQLQLEQFLHAKQQLSEQRTTPKTDRPDHSP